MTRTDVARGCAACGTTNLVPGPRLAEIGRCRGCQAELGPIAEPLDVDAETFTAIVTSSPVPILVDFWARWCPPCRMAAPGVNRAARTMSGRAIVLKVNTDQHPDVAAQFNVRGIPNFVVLKRGQVLWQHAGYVGHRQIKRWLEAAMVQEAGT
jgi:thioredoxin 2